MLTSACYPASGEGSEGKFALLFEHSHWGSSRVCWNRGGEVD